ncbi:PLP-dependent aminotransferase family protein [Candidatus Puniceispirillum sp.]|uniref:aminotransferase-like domain-containing protein n=1 Tax=Candidatus Puniceispirillum sp. TaxID=2026719 RepID=UPI001ED20BCC|nr:PLP-dependent aminotransferase family protein [Candidatus Puniceispirillum sp.]
MGSQDALSTVTSSEVGKKDLVRRAICSRIIRGIYREGEKVPSCREIANQLQVSKNSAYEAYSDLVGIGILQSHNRSGFTVGMTPSANNPNVAQLYAEESSPQSQPPIVTANCRLPEPKLRAKQPKNWTEFRFPFVYNQIDTELFPIEAWRECSRLALGRKALPIWTSEAVDIDCPDLVFQLRQRLLHYRGIDVSEDEILITVGAQHALSIIATLFNDDDRPIAFENPGYQEARHLFHLYNNKIEYVDVGHNGLNTDSLPENFKFVYVTPGCQFPTMVVMPEEHQLQLIHKAEAANAMVIEDDYEIGLVGHLKLRPALKSHDKTGRVIYVGSLSKTLSPSIRMGYIVAHPDIIKSVKIIRSLTVRHPPSVVQETTAIFLAHGYHDAHLKNLRQIYSERWHIMNEGINRHLPMFSRGGATGGTSFWLAGPPQFDADVFATRLQKRGVLIEPGHIFFDSGNPKNFFRIGFPSVAGNNIDVGLRQIGQEAKSMLR